MAKKKARKKIVKKVRSKKYKSSVLAINGSFDDVLKASLVSAKKRYRK